MILLEPLVFLCALLATIGWVGGWLFDGSIFTILKFFSIVPVLMYDLLIVDYIQNYIRLKRHLPPAQDL